MKMVHVTINTADLEKSLAFYQEIVGLKIQTDMRQKGGMPIVFLGNGQESTCVELIENKEQPYSGSGLSIGFHVDDVDAMHKWMEEQGLQPSPVISPDSKSKFFFVNDPNGVSIQFIRL